MVGRRRKSTKVIMTILLIGGAVYAGFPVLWMFISSLKSNNQIFEWPPVFFDKSFSFNSYIAILTDPEKIRYFFNSYAIAFIVVFCTLVIGIMAAYAFSRFNFPLKGFINTAIISVQSIPPIVLLIPYMSLIVTLKMFNTYWALILTYLVFTLPYCILMVTGYFNTISTTLDEAILIDGASRFTALWKVIVPISVPILVSVGMYTFMQSWNEYLFALVLTKTTDMRTVPVGINLLMGQHTYDWSQMMAMSFLGSLPVLLLFLFFQRYFIAGMSGGAVKE